MTRTTRPEARAVRGTAVAATVLLAVTGCLVPQDQNVPGDVARLDEPHTGGEYYRYVPSYYSESRAWPVVITLHGTPPWDTWSKQISAWKALAEREGFIVVAPKLRSSQGILPVVSSLWFKDLARDEQAVLAVLEQVSRRHRIDANAVLLTGFSSGGYALYYTGLRNPERFSMLVARACNCRADLLDRAGVDERNRSLPVAIMWGRDDFQTIRDQSWLAFRYLRERGLKAQRKELPGGHLRWPALAYELFRARMQHRPAGR
jgi:poly(3-hydroxybutyrate) depolymerase